MTSQPATKAPAIPRAGTYRIDTASSAITYTSRHMFGLGTVRANFSIESGQLDVGESLADSKATATIAAGSFTSGNLRRDSDVKGPSLLDADSYPLIEFTSSQAREDDRGKLLDGTVAMRGVVVPVQLLISSWEVRSTRHVTVRAWAHRLDRYSFGITGSKGLVGRYFDLDFNVVAVRHSGL